MHYFLFILFLGYITMPFSSADKYQWGEVINDFQRIKYRGIVNKSLCLLQCPKVDPVPDFNFDKVIQFDC